MRDEHYTPFKGPPSSDPPAREAVTVFVMARLRGDRTDSMRGSLRTGPHGWEAVYLLNDSIGRSGSQRRRRPARKSTGTPCAAVQ